MPRVAAVSVQNAVAAIIQFGSHFGTEKLPAWSSEIWKQMSTTLNGAWTAECVYTNVTKNRRNILDLARKEMNISISKIVDHNNNLSLEETTVSIVEKSSDSEVSLELGGIGINQQNLETFDLVLTELQWTEIKPTAIATDSEKCSVRPKLSLTPGVWTNVIAIAMWQQFRMPCAFVFKRADVSLSNDEQIYEIKITGACKSKKCANIFYGHAEKNLISKGLVIKVRARDTRDEKHDVVKRPLNGKRRKEAQKDIKHEGAATWKKREARKCIQPGDVEPPILPHSSVLQQARQEYLNAELSIKKNDSRDLVRTIEEMALKQEYSGIIHSVSSRPFYVFYCAPAQLHAYKEYCRLNRRSNFICIDATGSVVKTLGRSDGTKTGHIFLYSIVIHFDSTTIAINQMLSEQHDTEFIEFWLKRWIRGGATKPKEAVCDYSRALLSALSLAFNNQTVKAYVSSCFSQILKPRSEISEKPATRIRVDVAHLIHLICRWKCFKSLKHPSIKEFFVRCLALMVECKSLSDFEEILILTCVVGSQTHEDAQLVITEANTAREARKKLENYIANWGVNVDISIEDPMKDRAKDRPESFELDDINAPDSCKDDNIIAWIQQRVSRATETRIAGQELNPFYLPDFIKNMSRLCREFPLWTMVGMDDSTQRATSSYVEAYFNDIKNRVFKNTSRPIRVDKFIKIHAVDIAGATSLFSSKLIQFNMERCEDPCAQQQISEEVSNNTKVQFVTQNIADSNSAPIKSLGREFQSIHAINFDDSDLIPFQYQSRQDSETIIDDSVCMPIEEENNGELDIIQNDSDLMSTENWRGKAKPVKANEPDFMPIEDWSENVSNIHISNPVASISNDQSFITIESRYRKTTALSVEDANSFEQRLDQSCDLNSRIDLPCSTLLEDELNNNTELILEALADHSYSKLEGLTAFENITGAASLDHIDASLMISTNVPAEQQLKSSEEFLQIRDQSDAAAYTNVAMEYHNTSVGEDKAFHEVNPRQCPLTALEHHDRILPKISTETDRAKLKPTKISKYFRPYPEVRQMNVLQTKRKKTSLLVNGLHCPAVNINKQSFFVHRTCSFDSLVQLLLTGALDHIEYSTFIKTSTNKTLQLVWQLTQSGVTQKTYSERIVILKQFCPVKVQMSTDKRVLSYMIDAELSIAHLVEQVMKSDPSIENIEECPNSGRRVYPCISLAPNHKTIGKYGFGSLEKGLEFQSPIYNIRCRDPCPGKYTLLRQLNHHIFIELDIRPNLQAACGLKCMLRQIPTILHLKQNPQLICEYWLVGVVAYTPGHYSAYCLRTSGHWEFYNDLLPDMRTCSSDTNIEPHLALYIRKNERK